MKKFSEMTDAEKAEKVALKMGWELKKDSYPRSEEYVWTGPDSFPKKIRGSAIYFVYTGRLDYQHGEFYWNPCHSLDQCAVFEGWLINNSDSASDYSLELDDDVFATPSQRTEAFLKVTGGCE